LSHELGHYFGLAHTFGGEICNYADKSNMDGDKDGQEIATTDDDVTDTNPDLSDACVGGFVPTVNCPGGTVTYNGLTWDQPWTNVMSYHDCYPEELTPDQIKAIDRTLTDPKRAGLVK
ncbi:MAG: hypothetical protein HZA12_04470, partial [Nitrospirae bacterium]|nr:hypothetical protein [Nitrospirota bacterium]